MLKKLIIENFILIEKQTLNFPDNINVLTGETGSGKSVIINSIKFITGMRANSDMYLNREKAIKVTATFALNNRLKTKLDQYQIEYDDEIEVYRHVSPSGASKIRINGELVTLADVQALFKDVITIYSQYSVAKFKQASNYIEIVDSMIDDSELFQSYKNEYDKYRALIKELNQCEQMQLLKEEKSELLSIRLNDLEQIDDNVSITNLITEQQEIENALAMRENYDLVNQKLDLTTEYLQQLITLITDDDSRKLINDALINVEEVSYQVNKQTVNVDQAYLTKISDYISLVKRLSRKYNIEIEHLNEYKLEIENELNELSSIDADIENLQAKIEKQYSRTFDIANQLSVMRQAISPQLSNDVNNKLKQLSLANSDFKIEFKQTKLSECGIDECTFYIMINAGSEYTPIHKTASGGEVARFLLASECALQTETDNLIIFDEIDTGVSGHVASEMALMMKQIAKTNKLIIVTHLAQVAAISQTHLLVTKKMENDETKTYVETLEFEQKVQELAKIISGTKISAEALKHAASLLHTNGGIR